MSEIAYTVGSTKSYNLALERSPSDCKKLGRSADYESGWVWKTSEEAQAFLTSPAFLTVDWGDGLTRDPRDFSVYIVHLDTGWESDVLEEGGYNYLLRDSKFEKLT